MRSSTEAPRITLPITAKASGRERAASVAYSGATTAINRLTIMLISVGYSLLLISLAFLPKGSVLASMPTLFLTGFLAMEPRC